MARADRAVVVMAALKPLPARQERLCLEFQVDRKPAATAPAQREPSAGAARP